jgi:hypothetical protein
MPEEAKTIPHVGCWKRWKQFVALGCGGHEKLGFIVLVIGTGRHTVARLVEMVSFT